MLNLQTTAKQQVHVARLHYQDLQRYHQAGLLTIIDVHRAQLEYEQANLNLHQINVQIADNQQDYVLRQEDEYNAKLRNAEKDLATLTEEEKLYTLTAPADGSVSQLWVQAKEYVTEGTPLVLITTPNHLYAKALFNANDIYKLIEGRKVNILLPNYHLIEGEIVSISSFTEISQENPLLAGSNQNKVVVIIDLKNNLPQKYQISGVEVKVLL